MIFIGEWYNYAIILLVVFSIDIHGYDMSENVLRVDNIIFKEQLLVHEIRSTIAVSNCKATIKRASYNWDGVVNVC